MKVPDSYYTELKQRLKNSKVKITEDLNIVSDLQLYWLTV